MNETDRCKGALQSINVLNYVKLVYNVKFNKMGSVLMAARIQRTIQEGVAGAQSDWSLRLEH